MINPVVDFVSRRRDEAQRVEKLLAVYSEPAKKNQPFAPMNEAEQLLGRKDFEAVIETNHTSRTGGVILGGVELCLGVGNLAAGNLIAGVGFSSAALKCLLIATVFDGPSTRAKELLIQHTDAPIIKTGFSGRNPLAHGVNWTAR